MVVFLRRGEESEKWTEEPEGGRERERSLRWLA